MNLHGINPDQIGIYWPLVQPLLEKPLVRTNVIKDYDTSHLLDCISDKSMQCWIAFEEARVTACFITQIHAFQKRKVLAIPFVGAETGTIDTWIGAMDVFREFAKAHGCSAIRGWGRKGWERVLKPDSVRIEFDIEV